METSLRSEHVFKESTDITFTDIKLHKLVNSILPVSFRCGKKFSKAMRTDETRGKFV